MVQLSHPYMTSVKAIALTEWPFVGKVMSLLFNMLSRLFIAFLPRSMCLLISWLQSPCAVILEPKEIVSHCFHCIPIYLPWSDWTGCHDLCFFGCWDLSQLFHSPVSLSSRGSIPSLQKTKIMASGPIASWQIDGKTMQTDLCCNVSAFNMLSRLVIAFLPRSKRLLISWTAITICSDFGAQRSKVSHCSHCFPIYLPWSDWTGCHDLCFLNAGFTLFFHFHQEAL